MKKIIGIELSHQKAPLAVREKISFHGLDLEAALLELKSQTDEVFIIGTCNRLAVYAVCEDKEPILQFFRKYGALDPYLSIFDTESSAIRHLFATAAGLESQAIGEHEILGQLKKAYSKAQELKTIGAVMDEFIRKAIFVGKKVRRETEIGQHPLSLASVSYDVIRSSNHDIKGLSVLVLGTGEMSGLMLKIFQKKNFKNLYIASKTPERAASLAGMYNGKAIDMEDAKILFHEADIVVGATHTGEYIINSSDINPDSIKNPKTLVDLGLPRNFDPELKKEPNIKLFDLDDLKSMTYQGMLKRQEEIPKAMLLVEHELNEFIYWLNTRNVSPVISSYYDKMEKIREEELKWALPKLGNLDEAQRKIVENLVSRLTRRVSGKPIEKLRAFSQEPSLEQNPIETFKTLFDL